MHDDHRCVKHHVFYYDTTTIMSLDNLGRSLGSDPVLPLLLFVSFLRWTPASERGGMGETSSFICRAITFPFNTTLCYAAIGYVAKGPVVAYFRHATSP